MNTMFEKIWDVIKLVGSGIWSLFEWILSFIDIRPIEYFGMYLAVYLLVFKLTARVSNWPTWNNFYRFIRWPTLFILLDKIWWLLKKGYKTLRLIFFIPIILGVVALIYFVIKFDLLSKIF